MRTIKIVSVFLLIGFIFFNLSFAADNSSAQSTEYLQQFFQFLISFLSRGWVLLASIAGKLMTNDMVYGSFIHMDVFIWKARNIMKNFANYALGFGFLFFIIKSIFSKGGAAGDTKNKIIGFVLAGVLVQASRFIFGAIIDVSTITLVSISSFPGQILQSNTQFQKQFNELSAQGGNSLPATGEVLTGMEMIFNPNKKNGEAFFSIQEKPLDKGITQDNYLDMILPSYNNISGPLIFMGASIFSFQDYSLSNPKTTSARKLFLEFGINLFIILVYSIGLLFLVFINFIRIFYLRIFIIFSPFIILLGIAQKTELFGKKGSGGLDKIMEHISFTKVLSLIFKPVIFMAYVSIMLIFVIGVKAILVPQEGGNVNISDNISISSQAISTPAGTSYNSSIKSEDVLDFTVNGAKNSLADLIVAFFTLFLMWFLIKMALSKGSGIDRLDKNIGEQTKKLENLAGQLPIMPIAGGVGVNSVFGDENSIKSGLKDKYNVTDTRSDQSEDRVNELLGIAGARKTSYSKNLENDITKSKDPLAFRNNSSDIAKSIQGGLSITDGNRNPLVQNRWETRAKGNEYQTIEGTELKKADTLDKFLDLNAGKIDNLMGGDGSISNYENLKKQYYGISKE
ncbi:hypothetical protein K9M48_02960 [Candidatus Gracilibacteria bacterium]|nr:hypothetical protein [Candidatus Gracilibacteria bacterium]